ncbi:hypothetical protein KSP39_PZI019233 [Platanthera zijinensis]|uniref:J domain-containing protein n=1 Tax=Platanthera zijinensis TaxID=2320716 RepID=A0AAP0B1N8_9ASPA
MNSRLPVFPDCAAFGKSSVFPSPRSNDLRRVGAIGRRPAAVAFPGQRTNKEHLTVARGASGCRCYQRAAERTESFYDLLGIPASGSHEEIKRAYKQMARKYHPDVSPPDRAKEYTQCFIMVQEAYETLSNPACRELYDRHLAHGFHFALSSRRQFDEVRFLPLLSKFDFLQLFRALIVLDWDAVFWAYWVCLI